MTLLKKSVVAIFCAALIFGFFFLVPCAYAQEGFSGLVPSGGEAMDTGGFPGEETHPPLRLTPDKSEILVMGENVGRVIIGNETHLNILMDTTKRLVIVPRVPGATYFTLLGENGKVLMQRYAIIAAPEEKYVRIRQPCTGKGQCMPLRMFYCPDMCHEISLAEPGSSSSSTGMSILNEAGRSGSDDKNNAENGSSAEGEQ